VAMVAPVGKPTLEIRDVRLSNDDPGSEHSGPSPLVDEFGQWIPARYPREDRNLATEEGVGRGGPFLTAGRFRLLQVGRIPGDPGQGNRLLPRGADRRAMVVRGPDGHTSCLWA